MDVNQLFARAEAHFQSGRMAEARSALAQVRRLAGDHEAVLHLLALVEKRSGNATASERAFVSALKLAPRDPQINNNFANLLDELGRSDAAMTHYGRALQADAGFTEARLNRGLLLQRLGRLDEALRDYDAVLARAPANVRAHSARGSALRERSRFADAAAAYDAALALAPAHVKALDGRARVALEAGEPGASDHFRRALAVQPDNTELVIGMAEALEAEGDAAALPFLTSAVASRPDWIEGQERLAEMRSENAEPGHFARGYDEALARDPANRALHYSHWRALALAGRYAQALEAMDRARLPEDRDTRLMKAVFLGEAGEPERAQDLLAGLGDDIDVLTARARTLLRLDDAPAAARLFEQVVAARIDDIAAWAHLGLAWRLAGDPRDEWLSGQPGLYGTVELDLDPPTLAALAPLLRGLHKTRAHPIGQSLRGGTQTRGRLFWRSEPEIVALVRAIEDGLARFVDRLPSADTAHPMLRHRDAVFAITGSWSVRLTSSGFHINHIHPQGVLSSACYISLPAAVGAGGTEGWLELGAPPAELGLALEPRALIEPVPGRLALFPSYLYHGTRPFQDGERLTVAFDVTAR